MQEMAQRGDRAAWQLRSGGMGGVRKGIAGCVAQMEIASKHLMERKVTWEKMVMSQPFPRMAPMAKMVPRVHVSLLPRNPKYTSAGFITLCRTGLLLSFAHLIHGNSAAMQ